MPFPNVVFVGAPKCGTSSAFAWLTAHPDCFGSTPKEPFFLLDEGHPLTTRPNIHADGLDAYASCFPGYGGQRIVCEASTHYLYQTTALATLAALKPRPKIIALLRRPELRILSSFLYTRNNLTRLDRGVTFAEYAKLLLEDRVSELASRFTHEGSRYVLERDLKYSEYITYLGGWLREFGRENVHVEIFRPFVDDPTAGMRRIARFLEVDETFYETFNFGQKNATVSIPMQSLHRMALKLKDLLPRSIVKNTFLRNRYFELQSGMAKEIENEDVEPSLKILDEHFQPFNARLETALRREIPGWKKRW